MKVNEENEKHNVCRDVPHLIQAGILCCRMSVKNRGFGGQSKSFAMWLTRTWVRKKRWSTYIFQKR